MCDRDAPNPTPAAPLDKALSAALERCPGRACCADRACIIAAGLLPRTQSRRVAQPGCQHPCAGPKAGPAPTRVSENRQGCSQPLAPPAEAGPTIIRNLFSDKHVLYAAVSVTQLFLGRLSKPAGRRSGPRWTGSSRRSSTTKSLEPIHGVGQFATPIFWATTGSLSGPTRARASPFSWATGL